MFNFDLKSTAIYQAVKYERYFAFRLAKPLKKIFSILFWIFFLAFLFFFLFKEDAAIRFLSLLLGLSIISFVFGLFCRLGECFFSQKVKNPEINFQIDEVLKNPENYNLAELLGFESARAVSKSIGFSRRKKLDEINSTSLFYFLIKDSPNLNFIFYRILLNPAEVKKILKNALVTSKPQPLKSETRKELIFSQDFQDTILEAAKRVQGKNRQRIEIGDILTALCKFEPVFKEILINSNLQAQDIENLVWWLELLEEKSEERKKFWEGKNLAKIGSLAKNWAAGYTVTLDKFSIDLSEVVKRRGLPEIIGHEKEIEQIERVLARREQNNVLIVGEPGSGRKTIVEQLAVKSVLGRSLTEVNHKRVVQLDLPSLLAQIGTAEEVEIVLDAIFKEALTAGNVILVIDEFHNFVGGGLRPGVVDIAGVLASYLSIANFQILALTTFAGLHKNIEQNPSLLSLFEKVEVVEISENETLMVLENLTPFLEAKYKKFISYPALRDIVNYCVKYLSANPFPEKAIELLDETAVYVARTKDKVVLPSHVAKIVTEKTEIPVGELETKEKKILLNLENLIHERIINQEEAVKEISSAMRRARADITIRKGPIGCFLFLGPTGVGKTETAKAVAEIYFGSEEKMIRLDMSEFQNVTDIPRLIGSSTEEGLLTTQVRETPFALLLLDEIEKAHPNILNLFLQVLDEGHLTDGLGRKVDFKNTIIIATSNAGYQVILEALKKGMVIPGVKKELLDFLFQEGIFRPEFINRFDAVVVFRGLTTENLLDIADLMLKKLKKNLAAKAIDFIISESLKRKIVDLGYDPVFGARAMRRVIQDKVENVLASALLSGELKRGSRVAIEPEEFKLTINP